MSRTRLLAFGLGLGLVALLLVPSSAASAGSVAALDEPQRVPGLPANSGSVLGYQCGAGVCLVDPDVPGAAPIQVVPDGRFAGVTADGKTVAWVQPDVGLVVAPTTGGTPTTVYNGSVGNQPVISPDGASFLWQFPVPVAGFYYTYRFDVATGEVYGVSACVCTVTHGWAGATSIGAFPSAAPAPSRICVIGRGGSSSSCESVLAADARGQLAFPDGSADAQTFVASVDPDASEFGGSAGPIGLYTAATGALVKDLTTGAGDATPTLSQEGDRVAFNRADQIVIVDIATGAERVVGPGVYPSWGGTRSNDGGDNASASVKGKKLRVKAGKVKVKVACSGVGACQGKATLAKNKLVFAKKGYSVVAGTTGAVKLKLTKAGKQRFRGNGKAKLTLTLNGNGAKERAKVTVKF